MKQRKYAADNEIIQNNGDKLFQTHNKQNMQNAQIYKNHKYVFMQLCNGLCEDICIIYFLFNLFFKINFILTKKNK